MKRLVTAAKEMSKGIFWVIDGELLSFPFYSNEHTGGVAKSGDTYNHKRLWDDIKPKGNEQTYNYYPRGRVDITNKGKPVIYLNPTIEESMISQIRVDFGLTVEPNIQYDYSGHYKCYTEDGWKPDNSK